jgi:hypothetical protein
MPNITHSIQEYCKKINSYLTFIDIISLFVTTLALFFFLLYLYVSQKQRMQDIVYQKFTSRYSFSEKVTTAPFGSVSGKTYTFSWCSGASRISEKNKVIFSNEEEAKGSGRTLSKLCKK